MPANKTQPIANDAKQFIAQLPDQQQRRDCDELLTMMVKITGNEPVMWGPSMIGFDQYHYRYESGREGDFFITGFAPRANNISVYIMGGFEQYADLLGRLGKHKTGKSCLYIKSLDSVDRDVLYQLVEQSVADMRERYH